MSGGFVARPALGCPATEMERARSEASARLRRGPTALGVVAVVTEAVVTAGELRRAGAEAVIRIDIIPEAKSLRSHPQREGDRNRPTEWQTMQSQWFPW